MTTITCPECKGFGVTFWMVSGMENPDQNPCDTCGSTGRVPGTETSVPREFLDRLFNWLEGYGYVRQWPYDFMGSALLREFKAHLDREAQP